MLGRASRVSKQKNYASRGEVISILGQKRLQRERSGGEGACGWRREKSKVMWRKASAPSSKEGGEGWGGRRTRTG